MTDSLNNPQRIECRLVMIDAHSMRILTTTAAPRPLLPRESIAAYTRVAEALNDAIEQRYGLRTMQLAFLPRAERQSYCAVHEIIALRKSVPRSLSLVELGEMAPGELSGEERAIVLAIMKGQASGLGNFARLGWIHDLLAKTGSYRDGGTMPAIRQLNQGIDFCLLSLTDTGGRKTWFKAVGEPNTREYALTVELARRFPEYLPRMLATFPEWNGWLTEGVEGVPLNQSGDKTAWEQTLKALAMMQRDSIETKASLRAAGAKDWTCARLRLLSKPFFADVERAMQAQTSTKAMPLVGDELERLQKDVDAALISQANSGIPETLIHGDIGHGNIIMSPDGPVFLDWAETFIGQPFLCAEHLLADLERCRPELSLERNSLRRSYASFWREYASPETLADFIQLAPAIAAFSYAVFAWEACARQRDPTYVWPLIRSMMRRTRRELEMRREVAV